MGYSHGGDGKPGKPRGNNVCRRNYPSSPTAYRYLNTGAVVGAAGALRPLMDSLPLLRGIIPPRCIIDDQGLMNHAFLYTHDRWGSSQNNERWQELNLASFGPSPCMKFDKPVGLDTRARLFHNLGAGAIADLWYPASSSRPRNNATGSEPYLLHCNGDKAPAVREIIAAGFERLNVGPCRGQVQVRRRFHNDGRALRQRTSR